MTKDIISAVMSELGKRMSPKRYEHMQRLREKNTTHIHDFSDSPKCRICHKYKSQFGTKYKCA
jgi:hypothetical protein